MFNRFSLILVVTHACNLRCSYCYTGRKFHRKISDEIGRKSIDRAIESLSPGGTLELGFFGGEPLIEATLITAFIEYARVQTSAKGMELALSLTTNGTYVDEPAWSVMMDPDLDLAVSCDGVPAVHDRHRPTVQGVPTANLVTQTIRRLVDAGREFRVVMVVGPDTVADLPSGIRYLRDLGVRHIEPSLNLWTHWAEQDIARLEEAVAECADIWREGLPDISIGWFDEKAAGLAKVPVSETARCGFGRGELAVAPSGRLYPCERLMGEDASDNPMALPGHVMDGDSFLDVKGWAAKSHEACDECEMLSLCNTICRCSNYLRTGDVRRPDWLLCAWNQACLINTARVMSTINVSGLA
jgi:uncharacterized protein